MGLGTNQFKIRLVKFAQRGEPPHATFRKIQNSKLQNSWGLMSGELGTRIEYFYLAIFLR
ncbi:hypothetical protein FDUTEX481_09310 [Tolypothrix sp. PCC 7601]|nr:hypothetical protein FDUTEX481_09310 [Tolypothrix sp. PCC 7601]